MGWLVVALSIAALWLGVWSLDQTEKVRAENSGLHIANYMFYCSAGVMGLIYGVVTLTTR